MKRNRTELPITLPVYYAQQVVAGVQGRCDAVLLLDRVGMGLGALQEPRRRLLVGQFSRLYALAVQRLDDELLGLLDVPVRRGFTEVLCRVALGADTIAQAMSLICLVFAAAGVAPPRYAVQADGRPSLCWPQSHASNARGAFADQVVLITCYALLCWLARGRLPVAALEVPFSQASAEAAELGFTFGCQPVHEAPRLVLTLTAQAGAARVVRHVHEVAPLVQGAPGSFIEAVLHRGVLVAQVRSLLHASLPTLPTLANVADRLALSPRTLHRRLEAEGESFQSLKDQLRRDLAVEALSRGRLPIKQVALALGFADQAAFQRAFLQWTGATPGAYAARRGAQRVLGA